MHEMKNVWFWGSSLDDLREFPKSARHEAGYQIDQVQRGLDAGDWNICPQSAPASAKSGSSTTPAHSGSSASRIWQMGFTFFTAFKKRAGKQTSATLNWLDNGTES